jgi:histidyl-tRNA synthetase
MSRTIQSPKGTRDYYPADMLRRRFIEKAWRDVSIRHGFEEIDGPTFEHAELYTVKSGEGILNEIFGVFSGKDQQQVAEAATGLAPFALRPEFTPTLARMYVARAAQLARPTKWFSTGPYFRAERPQRGRLREFLQWNVDFIGSTGFQPVPDAEDATAATAAADAETIACCIDLLASLGLTAQDVRIGVNDRRLIADLLNEIDIPVNRHSAAMTILDKADRMADPEIQAACEAQGLSRYMVARFHEVAQKYLDFPAVRGSLGSQLDRMLGLRALITLHEMLSAIGYGEWIEPRPSIVRGLAYYTGMVFEVHEATGAERAIAGGGRYDNLIELFGGPPTPAVGFGMGDVVLSLVLQDRGLMPEGAALMDRLGEKPASPRPELFTISNGTPEADAQLRPLVARLRRAGVHVRHTYKATRNVGKLLKEASDAQARFAAIIESADEATLKDLSTGAQSRATLNEIAEHFART